MLPGRVTDTVQTLDHPKTANAPLIPRCFRAALAFRELSVEDIARLAQVSSRHLQFVVKGQRRASSRVLAVVRDALGPSGWAFAVGATDTLRDEGGEHGPA